MRHLLPVLLLLVCGCGLNPRTTAPVYQPAAARPDAARHLYEALARGGREISEVRCDGDTLSWREPRAAGPNRTLVIGRELELRQVSAVSRPARDSVGWLVHVDASGGRVTLLFRDSVSAARAESALLRLSRPD
ncbi:MAG: hypothetical protein HS108_07425 [Planctomycetes bacterium]|nr:hypothetical protein [Planctomycetota bacterium]MCL4731898.1 hypothetical protein [Planctomycetota bacterium]